MRVAFHTLGCKVNQYETEVMKEQFAAAGFRIVAESEPADVYIINTCTVTGLADRKSRQIVRRMKKQNPNSVIAATGCYVQTRPEELGAVDGVDILAGINEKHRILEYVRDVLHTHTAPVSSMTVLPENVHIHPREELTEYEESGMVTGSDGRTRACVKIQEGCDRFCSYCVIPYARGPVRSRREEVIVNEVRQLAERGFQEVVLTGINTALYPALPHLLSRLDVLEGNFRIRLSSLEPTVVNAASVRELFGFDRLCHHLHLSIQSGSNRVLQAMNRHYDRDDYFRIVDALRKFDPTYGITTDMIVGFPGETEADFQDSLDAVQRSGFGKVHVFRYSPRPGTRAAQMPDQINNEVKKNRAERMLQQSEETARGFFHANEGEETQVLFESGTAGRSSAEKTIEGYSDHYIRVYARAEEIRPNVLARMKLRRPYRDGMWAEKV